MSQQGLIEADARLRALRSNLPIEFDFVEEKYVQEFHGILDLLKQVPGIDLTNFCIPPSEVKPRGTTGMNYCDRRFLMMKIDGVLTFFESQSSSPKPKIGFSPPV